MTLESVRWKLRQKYSQLRSFVSGGRFVWQVEPNIRFVARTDEAFSHVLYVCGGHEKTELEWCRHWLAPGDSLIDCGANIGYFSAYLAQGIALERIIAVEGNPRTASVCADNFAVLGITNATVIQAILSASAEEKLCIPDQPGREPWQRTIRVEDDNSVAPVSTLDLIIARSGLDPSLVKIDCEGFEPFILQGARRLLQLQRAAFMIECNDHALLAANTNRRELFGMLKDSNYALFHLASFDSFHPFGIDCDEHFPATEFNFAAIPNTPRALEKWRSSSNLVKKLKAALNFRERGRER